MNILLRYTTTLFVALTNKMKHFRLCILVCYLVVYFSCNQAPTSNYKSVVKSTAFSSKIAKDSVAYNVYLPKIKTNRNLPILYLLHGHGGNQYDWFDVEEGNVKHILDSLIAAKKIPPLIAVSLNAKNSWYVNHSSIAMEDIYIKEFIPHIKKQYKKIASPHQNIIAGNSMGGYGALNYALKYPKQFHDAILLAPAAYNPLPPQLSSSRKIPIYKKDEVFNDSIWNRYLYTNVKLSEDKSVYPTFYTSTGDDDPFQIFDVVVQLKDFFEMNNLKHEITIINGKHSWDVWRVCFIQDLIRAFEAN